jgi:hypothetical protein
MFFLGFGIACIPTARQGSLRDPGGRDMTIKQLVQHLQKAREQDPLERVRDMLSDKLGEHTIYKPTSRWNSILTELGIGDLVNKTICVTCYGATSDVFNKVKSVLANKYKTVVSVPVDELGYRRLFLAGNSADQDPELLVAVNFYEEPRQVVKSAYNEDTDAGDTGSEDLDLDLA